MVVFTSDLPARGDLEPARDEITGVLTAVRKGSNGEYALCIDVTEGVGRRIGEGWEFNYMPKGPQTYLVELTEDRKDMRLRAAG